MADKRIWLGFDHSGPSKPSKLTFGNHGVLPCAHFEESGASTISELDVSQLRWSCDTSGSSEASSFSIKFSDGSFGYAQFVYSSLGLSPVVQTLWRYWASDEDEDGWTNSFNGSVLELRDDKRFFYINEGNYIKVMSEGSYPTIELCLSNKERRLSLKFSSKTPAVAIKGGKTEFKSSNSAGVMPAFFHHFFLPLGTVSGEYSRPDKGTRSCSGVASGLHGIQSTRPNLLATKWDMFAMVDGEKLDSLLLLQCSTPALYARQLISQAIIVRGSRVVCCTTKAQIKYLSEEKDPANGYSVPNVVEYRWAGETSDGEALHARTRVNAQNRILRFDILAELPFLLRKIVQAFISKPFTYMWWDDGEIEVKIGNDSFTIHGKMYRETSFINLE